MSKKKPTYQEALNELENIVTKLENDNTDIDELSILTRRAAELVTYCRDKLRSTEEELKANMD